MSSINEFYIKLWLTKISLNLRGGDSLNNYAVKFILNYDYSIIGDVFNKAKNILNWQFDENFNVNLIDADIDYQVKDVSDLAKNEIEEIADSFFSFTFDNINNTPLYKLLVLEDNGKTIVKSRTYSNLKHNASSNDVYDVANALASLQQHSLLEITKIDNTTLA